MPGRGPGDQTRAEHALLGRRTPLRSRPRTAGSFYSIRNGRRKEFSRAMEASDRRARSGSAAESGPSHAPCRSRHHRDGRHGASRRRSSRTALRLCRLADGRAAARSEQLGPTPGLAPSRGQQTQHRCGMDVLNNWPPDLRESGTVISSRLTATFLPTDCRGKRGTRRRRENVFTQTMPAPQGAFECALKRYHAASRVDWPSNQPLVEPGLQRVDVPCWEVAAYFGNGFC